MHILIVGATGFIGRALVDRLKDNHQLTILIRRQLRTKDPLNQHTTLDVSTLQQSAEALMPSFDAIINLAGENVGAKRWSKKRKKALLDSRINSTHTIMQLCQKQQVKPLIINANGIGIYGHSDPSQVEPFTEESSLDHENRDYMIQLAQK